MELPVLKAEIKAWERDFKATHGREPSVQDIKQQPAIVAKYKLYKSLSKAASAPPARPSTPPRSAPRQPQPSSSIIPKSRAIKVDPPLSTSNPFSPVKNKKKLPDPLLSPQRASNQSRQNPFATPTKSRSKPHAPPRSPSPDPFPPIDPLLMVHRTPVAPPADSAVTRARKRLRGEPVSPSPVKEKRPRVASQAALSFTSHAAPLDSPDTSDGDEIAARANDTIIADTPMKPRTGGRNFKVLFDDIRPDADRRPVKSLSSRKKTPSSSHNVLAGAKRERSRALTPSSDEEEDWSLKPRLKGLDTAAVPARSSQLKGRAVNGKNGIPKALVPGKSDLWSDMGPPKSSAALTRSTSSNPTARPPNKRPLPDVQDDAERDDTPTNTFLNLPLLPPSPPPPDASKPSGPKYADKGKGKAAFSRKKAKILHDSGAAEDEDDDDSPEDEIQVRELDPLSRLSKTRTDTDSDWEVNWQVPPDPSDPTASVPDPGKLEVNLPDELQRILAISPGRRTETEEEKMVRGLLYGRRETHYDPRKGGEIWDVGEDEEHAGETEEDWEGEPVPWEVGEL
ncbi:DNA replication and checkpoint protein-domain-containing protein [Trametes maxima]|nr:DNA replication and checkpoint protein-domain-containing protein [Trametes maxima]